MTPDAHLEQCMEALDNANRIRKRRAAFKRDLKAGRVSIVDALLDPPDYLLTAKIDELMLAVPKYGRVKVTRVLNSIGIPWSKHVGTLTVRQRTTLAGSFYTGLGRVARDLYPAPDSRGLEIIRAELTPFQRAVLWHANDLGDASLLYENEIARRIGTRPQGVGQGRVILQRLGLLHEDTAEPTAAGMAVLDERENTDRDARLVRAA